MIANEDAALLHRLGACARVVDPVPAYVGELGRAAFGLLRLDSELAELVADSDVALAGVRGAGSDARLLTFEAGEVVVDIQVGAAGQRHTMLGQVSLVPDGVVVLESVDLASAQAPLDDLGGFRFDDVQPGLVRLGIELAGRRTVTTEWFPL